MVRRFMVAVSLAAVMWGAASSLRATENHLLANGPVAPVAPTAAATVSAAPTLDIRVTGEFAEMLDVTRPDAETRARFLKQLTQRQAALDAWDKSDKGRELYQLRSELQQARKANDADKITSLSEQIGAISVDEFALKVKLRSAILSTLTMDQQKTWTAHVLAVRVRDFIQGIDLSNVQFEQLRAAALEEAAAFLKQGVLEQDPYLFTLKDTVAVFAERIKAEILTEPQRLTLTQSPNKPTVPVRTPVVPKDN